jgi:hypothetical protein
MRRLVIHVLAPRLRHEVAVLADGVAARDHPGHVERRPRHVTCETTRLASEDGRGRRLVERVEDDALLRIVGGELEDGRAGVVADGDRLVEEESARVLRAGVGPLHAGFREHEQLRFLRHAKRVQDAEQITGARVAPESARVVCEGLIQRRHAIAGRSRGVLNGRMFVQDAGPGF